MAKRNKLPLTFAESKKLLILSDLIDNSECLDKCASGLFCISYRGNRCKFRSRLIFLWSGQTHQKTILVELKKHLGDLCNIISAITETFDKFHSEW